MGISLDFSEGAPPAADGGAALRCSTALDEAVPRRRFGTAMDEEESREFIASSADQS
ncbi:hypothetical protein ACFYUV_38905 [Nonomuraea sp. NPDC003560]|uniref:hypothetical protein n=1 Tax=Nonomuraea sp. NPDC003560 TaxID=3364341 RepID=UPI0036C3721D